MYSLPQIPAKGHQHYSSFSKASGEFQVYKDNRRNQKLKAGCIEKVFLRSLLFCGKQTEQNWTKCAQKFMNKTKPSLKRLLSSRKKKKTTKKHTTGLVAVFFSSYLHNEPNLLFHIMFNKSFLYVNTLSLFCSAYIQPPWALDFWGSA